MGAPDLGKADFAALLELAESKFNRWLRKEVLPERDRRLLGLKSQRLMFGGRAFQMQRIYEEFLCREVRGHIGFYAEVAHDSGNPEMLSVQRLAERREHIMTSVGHACAALKDTIKRDARAEGNVSETQLQALLDEKLYEQLSGRILNVVNDEIGVLEAEGNLSAPRESKASGAPAVSDSPARVKPGPHRDTRTAHKGRLKINFTDSGRRCSSIWAMCRCV
jgi:hypothetical protein